MPTNPKARLGCCPEGSCVDEAVIRAPLDAEIERLKADCGVFIASNGALTSEVLALRENRDRLRMALKAIADDPDTDSLVVVYAKNALRASEQKAGEK